MKRNDGSLLTTHAGSLPRPDDLAAMLAQKYSGGEVDPDDFESRVGSGVEEVVRRQIGVGVDVVSDGEWSKPDFIRYTLDRLGGLGSAAGHSDPGGMSFPEASAFILRWESADFPELAEPMSAEPSNTSFRFPSCDGPVTYTGVVQVQRDIANLKRGVEQAHAPDCFLSTLSPALVEWWCPNHYYATQDEYLEAIATAMREECEAIHSAGIGLQIDAPDLAMAGCFRSLEKKAVRDVVRRRIEAINHAVANIPADAMRLHVCHGNYTGPHHYDTELGDIIDLIYQAKPSGISIEMANPRHGHEWKIFETHPLPEGKYVVPGVLDVKTNIIEHPRLIAERLVRLAGLIGRENVLAGTDCGFATAGGAGDAVLPAIAWAKLQSLSEGAKLASKELW